MKEKNNRRTIEAEVIKTKMNKTVLVTVTTKVKHPMYKKYVKRTTKLMAHDEKNECKAGDIVTIKEVRPLSKNKSWLVTAIIVKGQQKIDLIDDGSENNDPANDKA